MQTLSKYRWAFVASVALAAAFAFFGFGSGTAYADYGDDVADCSYFFSESSNAIIHRTDCGSHADLHFNADGDINVKKGQGTYTEDPGSTRKHCKQHISLDSDSTGTLSGQYEHFKQAGKQGTYECKDFDPVQINITSANVADGGTPQDVIDLAYQTTVTKKLESLIKKECGDYVYGDPSYNYCTKPIIDAIYTCVGATVPKIKDTDKKRNEKFSDLFSTCLAAKTGGKLKKKDIQKVLGDNIYDEMLNAGKQASDEFQVDHSSQPTCEASGWSFNWLFCGMYDGLSKLTGWILDHMIIPLLVTSPICISASNDGCAQGDPIYTIWSNFRLYGNVFLVIALLVVVFGQVIGGGIVDAYTAKKILPRLLVAGVLINLSIYIVAGLVDITNIIGGSIGQLITAPLGDAGAFKITAGGGIATQGMLAAAAIGGGFIGLTQIAGILSIDGMMVLVTAILLPVFLVFLAIVATIAIRKAIILALIFIAPVAFALYCLPNTQKYFRKWWDVLLQMLMIYPIIIILFAVSSVLSVTVMSPSAQTANIQSFAYAVNYLISIIFLVLPLFLIPFSFKIAGSAIGRVFDLVDGGRQRIHAMGKGSREHAAQNFRHANIQSRQKMYASLMDSAGSGKKFRRATVGKGLNLLARGVGGYNIEAETSAARAATAKVMNDQIATGADSEIRALTVNKRKQKATVDDDGVYRYTTLGGARVTEAEVDRAYKRWGNDTFAQQTALSYEMRKAMSEDDLQRISGGYKDVAQGWGMNDQQAGGAWIGAAYENQNQHLEYKSYKYDDVRDADGNKTGQKVMRFKGKGLVDEIYEKRGSYNVAQMSSNTVVHLQKAYEDAVASNDLDTQGKIQAIAETFMSSYGGNQVGTGENDEPINDKSGNKVRQANTPGAAHTAERVRELAVATGVYHKAPEGNYVMGDGHAPPSPHGPNRREQN